MSRRIAQGLVLSALAFAVLTGCEGAVNDDENFIVLTFRASLAPSGSELTGPSDRPKITPDGRYVVFQTRAANLLPGDTNGRIDIYRKDLNTGSVARVTVELKGPDPTPDGNPNEDCTNPTITPDGRFVIFESSAEDLVDGDGNGNTDIFIRDMNLTVFDPLNPSFTVPPISRVSVNTTGGDPNSISFHGSVSDDGRYVVFQSFADNLVAGDTNFGSDIFVRDTLFNITIRVNTDVSGNEADAFSFSSNPVISGDGSTVAFDSDASNLVTTDFNGFRDVFVKRWLAVIPDVTRVSVEGPADDDGDLDGDEFDLDNANGESGSPSLSETGRFVAFVTDATDLIRGDSGLAADVYIRDVLLGVSRRCSVTTLGGEASQASNEPQVSRDGRWVVFQSNTPDLVQGDTNNAEDIFLRDTVSNITIRISVATYGVESSPFFPNRNPSITGDGRFVAFASLASNLAPNDTNGANDIYIRGPLY